MWWIISLESGCLGLQSKSGGKLHLRLNIDEKPIAKKYREGKLKRTLKRELKVSEIADKEAIGWAAIYGLRCWLALSAWDATLGVLSSAVTELT